MSKNVVSCDVPDIKSEASSWIAQLETGELSGADLEAFREWVSRSPRHAAEIKRLAELSMELNVLTEMAEPLRGVLMEYHPIVKSGFIKSVFEPVRVAVFVAVVGIILSLLFYRQQVENTGDVRLQAATSVGEYRDFELADGTKVKLNANTQIEAAYDNRERKVRLLKGEAFFDVKPDVARPFLVYAGENYIRVVGTAFLVRLTRQHFEVTVTQGRVELAQAETVLDGKKEELRAKDDADQVTSTFQPPLILEAGQSASISATREISPIVTLSERELQRELSWREGLHDFSNTPLEEVVNELTRHSLLEIEIADPALRDLKFGGIFRTGETEPLFDALASVYGIDVQYISENKVRLSLASQE